MMRYLTADEARANVRVWYSSRFRRSAQGSLNREEAASPLVTFRTYRPLQLVLIGLTFVTGMVDAITYLDLGHVFAANMTGNVVMLGFALAGAGEISVSASLVSLVAFLVGAMLGGRLGRTLEVSPHGWIVTCLGLEIALLSAALLAVFFRAAIGDQVVVGLLALAMGMRTANARRIGIPDISTTVLTSTLTGLAADRQVSARVSGAQARRLAAVTAMLLGVAMGTQLLRVGGAPTALGSAVNLLLLGTALYIVMLAGPSSSLDSEIDSSTSRPGAALPGA